MSLIVSVQKYIADCEKCLIEQDVKKAEELENAIIAVFSDDIKGIKGGLDRYKARVYSVGTVVKYDYLGDIKILKAKLEYYKAGLEDERTETINVPLTPSININNVNENSNAANATNVTQVTYEQVVESIQSLSDSSLTNAEKEELEDKIGAIELALRNQDKVKAMNKIGAVLRFIAEKGIEVGIAVLPYLGQISQALK